jgi:MFS family permease
LLPCGRVRRLPLIVPFGMISGAMGAGYGVLFTMLDDYRDEYGISESMLGAIIGIGFFAGFFSQILIAPRADRGHARQLVLLGVGLNGVGLVMMAVSTAFVPLFIGRLVMGIGIGMASPAIRRIVILAEPERLGQNLGRLLAADVGGFAIGPVVSAVLVGPFGIPAPFLVIAVATAIALPFVARVHVHETIEPPEQRFALDLLRIRPFAGAVALGSAVFLMIGAFDALWAVVLEDIDASEWMSNLGITLFALPLILFGAAGGRLAQRVGPFRLGTFGLLVGATCMFLYGLMPSAGAMFVVAMFHAVNDGFTVSSTGVAVGVTAPAERQAGAQGVLGGAQTLTAGLTAVVTGVLYEHFGRAVAYGVSAAAMVTLVAIGVLLAGPAWRMRGAIADSAPLACATEGHVQPVASA